jgi:hypothetical protein
MLSHPIISREAGAPSREPTCIVVILPAPRLRLVALSALVAFD